MRKNTEWFWVALALVLRVIFALKLGSSLYQIDEGAFDSAAWHLAQTGSLGDPSHPAFIAPIPSAFFAFFYLFGHHLILPRLGEALIGTGTAWALGRMVRQLTGSEPAGKFGLAVSAIYPFFIYYGGMLMSETLYLAAIVVGLWLLCRSLEEMHGESIFATGPRSLPLPQVGDLAQGVTPLAQSHRTLVRREGRGEGFVTWLAAGAGLALGLAALCRSEAAPIIAVIWAISASACFARRWLWKAWLAAVLCWAIPIAGWCARNKAVAGRFALDIHAGITMLHGTLLFDLNEQDTGAAMAAAQTMPFFQNAQSLPEAERDHVYFKEAIRFMRDHPRKTIRQWGRKFINFWRFYPRTDKAYHETATSHPEAGFNRKVLVAISLLFEPWLILLGLAGLWQLRSRIWRFFPLDLFLIGTTAIHVISVSQMRYRLPVMPILILGASFLIATVSRKTDNARLP